MNVLPVGILLNVCAAVLEYISANSYPFEFMPVVPYCSYRSPSLQSIHPVIAEGLQQVQTHKQARVISVRFDIPEVDPLLALAELSHSRERHLYLEHGTTQEAVAAFGTALFFQATGLDRFNQTRQFIQQWTPTIQIYDTASGHGAPAARFFCSFSFFSQGTGSGMDFPTASVMLPQWQITRHRSECTLTANLLLTSETAIHQLLDVLEARAHGHFRLVRILLCCRRRALRSPIESVPVIISSFT